MGNELGLYDNLGVELHEFGNYWFETGTPTYLVELLKKHHYDLHRMANGETDSQVLNSIDSESANPIPVILNLFYRRIYLLLYNHSFCIILFA